MTIATTSTMPMASPPPRAGGRSMAARRITPMTAALRRILVAHGVAQRTGIPVTEVLARGYGVRDGPPVPARRAQGRRSRCRRRHPRRHTAGPPRERGDQPERHCGRRGAGRAARRALPVAGEGHLRRRLRGQYPGRWALLFPAGLLPRAGRSRVRDGRTPLRAAITPGWSVTTRRAPSSSTASPGVIGPRTSSARRARGSGGRCGPTRRGCTSCAT